MKYYIIRILAGLHFMGAIGVGLLAGEEYGKWVGWVGFFILLSIGLILYILADKIRKDCEKNKQISKGSKGVDPT